MNSKKVSLFILVFYLSLSACNIQVQTEKTNPTTTVKNAFTASPSRTQRFTEIPSRTPLPSPTSSPTGTAIPSATHTATITASPTALVCWSKAGKIERGILETNLLRIPLDYRVYTPPCYEQQKNRLYAVLYLIHGQGFTDEQWDRIGADEIVDALAGEGEIAPIIIVMPHDRYGGEPNESDFPDVIVKELIPFIDSNYRTIPDREYRAVGGMSRGAGWAIHFAIAYFDTFGALGAHSPAVFHTDAQRMRTRLDAIPRESLPRIYMDIGDKDRPEIMRSAVWFEELLNEKDIPHEWYLFLGYHSEEYWQAHIEQYIRWYSQDWQ